MISCNDVQSLLSGYLDAELSEAQAKPLRGHLLGCCACRDLVQEGKVLSRWFKKGRGAALAIPHGFSARVARRAFAGDPGLLMPEASKRAERLSMLPFILKLTVVAAALLFVLALQIRQQKLPDSKEAQADNYMPPWVDAPAMPTGKTMLGLPAGVDGALLEQLAPSGLDDAQQPDSEQLDR